MKQSNIVHLFCLNDKQKVTLVLLITSNTLKFVGKNVGFFFEGRESLLFLVDVLCTLEEMKEEILLRSKVKQERVAESRN